MNASKAANKANKHSPADLKPPSKCDVHPKSTDWPSTAWLVEVVMLLLNFNVLGIRARHLVPEREAAVDAFNDAKNPV